MPTSICFPVFVHSLCIEKREKITLILKISRYDINLYRNRYIGYEKVDHNIMEYMLLVNAFEGFRVVVGPKQ